MGKNKMFKNEDDFKKIIARLDIDANPKDEHRENLRANMLSAFKETREQNTRPAIQWPVLWREIMRSSITKLAAAAVIIIAVLIGIHHFGGSIDGSNVAFGNVIGYLQTHSYTFDLTFEGTDKGNGITPFTLKAMIMELGRMRFDCPTMVGKISSITNLNTGKTLLLFHQNKSGVLMDESVLKKDTGAEGILTLCTRPIASLWNLRNGTEEQLGEKEIDGQIVTGFKISQKDKDFEYDITIWADTQKNTPYLVEIISKPITDKSFPVIKWTAANFNLDVELDEKLLSLEVPADYTLSYQSNLEDMKAETQPSAQAQKIEQMLSLWPEGKKTEALEILLGINWKEPINFGKEPYLFSMTEQGYITLKSEDQKRVMDDIMKTSVTVRKMVYEVVRLGQEAVSNKDYKKAEQYYEAGLQLGKLLSNDPDRMIVVRLVGIAAKKKILTTMIDLYTTTNNKEKLQSANEQLKAANAEGEEIKNKAKAIGQ
jgi:hypothetical protein